MGEAIVGDVAGQRCGRSWSSVAPGDREAPQPRPLPGEPERSDPISGTAAMAALASAWPTDGIAVVETPSSTVALRNRLRLSRPGSYYFSASGGLGFGIAAAVGVQLAQPERPVVCVLGEGSAQYGITALWTAAAYKVPVTFLVLRNEEYMILKWFARVRAGQWRPGPGPPGPGRGGGGAGLRRARAGGLEPGGAGGGAARGHRRAGRPPSVQVPVASGMWLD